MSNYDMHLFISAIANVISVFVKSYYHSMYILTFVLLVQHGILPLLYNKGASSSDILPNTNSVKALLLCQA